MLQSTGSPRVRHDLGTEQQQLIYNNMDGSQMNEWKSPVLKLIFCDIQDEAKLQGQKTHQWWPGGVGEGLNF